MNESVGEKESANQRESSQIESAATDSSLVIVSAFHLSREVSQWKRESTTGGTNRTEVSLKPFALSRVIRGGLSRFAVGLSASVCACWKPCASIAVYL